MIKRKKHGAEYILTLIAGILLIMNSSTFIASFFIPLPPDENLERLRQNLGEDEFRLFQIRIIVASIVSGSMLILLAIAMEKNPKDLMHYGIMTIIVSIISIIGIGLIYPTSVITTIVGMVGGALAVMKGRKGVVVIEQKYEQVYEDMEYRCSTCNINFNSDDELRQHMIAKHLE